MKNKKALIQIGLFALTFLFLIPAHAAIDLVVKSDGTDPTAFPGIRITHGNIIFDAPLAMVFGLDVDNNFAPLPDSDRYPNDFFDYMAKAEFLNASTSIKKARGILICIENFNNPDPTNPQSLARFVYKLPLVNSAGRPLGGNGPRWIVFQAGNNAGGGAGGAPGGGGGGRKAAYLKPQMVPSGMSYWAGFVRGRKAMPGETEAQLRARVKADIRAAKKKATPAQLARYDKLVDCSKFKDPVENFVVELRNSAGHSSVTVEMVFLVDSGNFIGLAELFDDFTVAITNEPARASMDPNNQPAGQLLVGSSSLDMSTDDTISMGYGDPNVDQIAVVDAVQNNAVAAGSLLIQFNGSEVLDDQGTVNYLDIGTTFADPEGVYHLIGYDQAVTDSPKSIAARVAEFINTTPLDGGYPYEAFSHDNVVQVFRNDGLPISSAKIRVTGESDTIFEQVMINAKPDGEVPIEVLPWVVSNETWQSTIVLFNKAPETDRVLLEAFGRNGERAQLNVMVPGRSIITLGREDLFPALSGYSLLVSSEMSDLYSCFQTERLRVDGNKVLPAQANGLRLSDLSQGLLFGFLSADQSPAIVLVAPEASLSARSKLTISLYGTDDTPLLSREVELEGKRPATFLLDELFESQDRPQKCAIRVFSRTGGKIAGTAFVFDAEGHPRTLDAVPVRPIR